MADFLAGMAIASRRRARAAARRTTESELRSRIADRPPPPALAPSDEGFDVVAEVKRRAPGDGAASAGPPPSTTGSDLPVRLADAYAAGGAVAVSVLTEPLAFGGGLDDLAAAARALADGRRPIPAMRKDFLVDPYQVLEAGAAGAGGVLLIADLVEETADAAALLDAAAETGLWVLVETFAEERLEAAASLARAARARGVDALLGVNVRDLRSLDVDDGRLARAAARLPSDLPAVAESGMRTPADVARAAGHGYAFALVGRALSRAPDARTLLAEMIRAGRAARREAVGT